VDGLRKKAVGNAARFNAFGGQFDPALSSGIDDESNDLAVVILADPREMRGLTGYSLHRGKNARWFRADGHF
jgi:hypothetical protein